MTLMRCWPREQQGQKNGQPPHHPLPRATEGLGQSECESACSCRHSFRPMGGGGGGWDVGVHICCHSHALLHHLLCCGSPYRCRMAEDYASASTVHGS
jgi:hypothetical protein